MENLSPANRTIAPSDHPHPPPQPTQQPQKHPRVGVGVVVVSPLAPDDATVTVSTSTPTTTATTAPITPPTRHGIWVGRRRGSHGSHTMALPGGHLEMYESWSDCATREVHEEMGITLSQVEFVHVTNDTMIDEQKHYITIFMMGYYDAATMGRPRNCEPDKCEGWELYTVPQLQSMIGTKELFIPLEHLLRDNPPTLEQNFAEYKNMK